MSDDPNAAEVDAAPKKKKSKAMLFALLGAVLLGGGTFYGIYSGMIPLPFGEEPKTDQAQQSEPEPESERRLGVFDPSKIAFVPLDEMIISLGPNATAKHLKVRISIEVEPDANDSVVALTPRIIDVLNTFLRAVDERDLEIPRGMLKLRSQMLRRVQLVTPRGAVRDVLIQEFVLN